MNSPFQYGKLATGSNSINRASEKQVLKDKLYSGINTVLVSPRRWGKTSLLKEVILELQSEYPDIRVCYLDLFKIRTEWEFYMHFAKEVIKSSSSSWESWITTANEFLKPLFPRISIGSDPLNDFSIGIEVKNLIDNERVILNLPEKIAQDQGIKLIICMDEFQNLAKLKGYIALEQNMHHGWQKQQKTSFCISASKSYMLQEIFQSPTTTPFSIEGDLMRLQKIEEEDWVQYVVDSFKRTGKFISKMLANQLVQRVKNHSWYVQQYSHFTWILTSNNVSENILNEAFNELIIANLPLFKRECEALTASQINLLIAIVSKEKSLTAGAVMIKYGLGTPQNVSKNKVLLQKRDLIEKNRDSFYFLDPVFEQWFIGEYL